MARRTPLEDDLRARAGRGRSPEESLDLLRPVFDAIAYAHEAHVAHRDLKPSNLMVMPHRRGEARVRVLDFGVARLMHPDETPGTGHTLTRDENGSFSLSHAAAEQVSHTRTGPWTDVHALALILVEVLVGTRAYPFPLPDRTVRRHRLAHPPDTRALRPRRRPLGADSRPRPRAHPPATATPTPPNFWATWRPPSRTPQGAS